MIGLLANLKNSARQANKSKRRYSLNFERLEGRELLAAEANLVAYRPITKYIEYSSFPVPDAIESDSTRGPGIRINGDDDNGNGVADRAATETGFSDDDLVRVDVDGTGTSFNLSIGHGLAVWQTNTKSTPIPNHSSVAAGQSLWVEFVGETHADADSAFLLLTVDDDLSTTTSTDHVVFHTFQSIVLAVGGNGQNPADFPDNRLGVFSMAATLYDQGYDVRLFAHGDISSNGSGYAYNEVVSAVSHRGVTEVATIGYSWGGSATYFLSRLLDANVVTRGKLVYSAYVDAIRRDSILPIRSETRKPVGTTYHDNFYQRKDWLLKGNRVRGANNVNVTRASWGESLEHTTIDDNAVLQSQLIGSIMTLVIM